jgi:hypothetical protein
METQLIFNVAAVGAYPELVEGTVAKYQITQRLSA